MHRQFLTALLTLVVCLSQALNAWSDERRPLVFSTVEGSFNSRIVEAVLREAYGRIGYDIHVKRMSGPRALAESSSGAVDGELQRIWAVGAAYPSLVRVEPPIFTLHGVPFALEGAKPVAGPNDLKGRRVGVQLGIKYAEKLVEEHQLDAVSVVDGEHLMRMLRQGRIDVVVTNRLNGLQFIRRAGVEGVVEVGPPLVSLDLYHYLHERHAQLVPPLGETLKEMRIDGVIERIMDEKIGAAR